MIEKVNRKGTKSFNKSEHPVYIKDQSQDALD